MTGDTSKLPLDCGHFEPEAAVCQYHGCANRLCSSCEEECETCLKILCPSHQVWLDGNSRLFCPDHSTGHVTRKAIRKLIDRI